MVFFIVDMWSCPNQWSFTMWLSYCLLSFPLARRATPVQVRGYGWGPFGLYMHPVTYLAQTKILSFLAFFIGRLTQYSLSLWAFATAMWRILTSPGVLPKNTPKHKRFEIKSGFIYILNYMPCPLKLNIQLYPCRKKKRTHKVSLFLCSIYKLDVVLREWPTVYIRCLSLCLSSDEFQSHIILVYYVRENFVIVIRDTKN